MALYAVGDVQGDADALERLLKQLHWDPARDHLWFTGDLVNRGPRSADVLRRVRGLGEGATAVLGNHDLHLLALWVTGKAPGPRDRLDDVLAAPDRDELLDWLRHRPLLAEDPDTGWTLVHAGLPPQWDGATARSCAREAEAVLRGPRIGAFFANMYGNHPDRWEPTLGGWDRLRFIVNAFTRIRYCTAEGALDYRCKGPPGTQAPGLVPWFQAPGRANRDLRLVFGHWAALGLYRGEGVLGLDTGCVWGGRLTAVRLDDPRQSAIGVPCKASRIPGRNGMPGPRE